jgi:hypothetical protein
MYVDLGSRVVLFNSVLNSIRIFYLSYFKMSVKIWKQIVQLQSNYVGELNRDNIVYLRLFRVLAQ